jgi:hypothetical protein
VARAIALVLLLTSAAAGADEDPVTPPPPPPRLVAARAFQEGQAAYRAKRCRDAAQAFARAYAIDPIPSLLYDEGEAWRCEFRMTGDTQAGAKAVDCLHRYLVDPDGSEAARKTADRHMREVAIDLPSTVTVDLRLPGDPPTPAQRQRRRRIGIIAGGVTAAAVVALALGLGIGLGVDTSNPPRIMPRW